MNDNQGLVFHWPSFKPIRNDFYADWLAWFFTRYFVISTAPVPAKNVRLQFIGETQLIIVWDKPAEVIYVYSTELIEESTNALVTNSSGNTTTSPAMTWDVQGLKPATRYKLVIYQANPVMPDSGESVTTIIGTLGAGRICRNFVFFKIIKYLAKCVCIFCRYHGADTR